MNELALNAVYFGILCNFPPFCGEERAKEAVQTIKDEIARLTAERDAAIAERDAAIAETHTCWTCANGFETEDGWACGQRHYTLTSPGCLNWKWNGL